MKQGPIRGGASIWFLVCSIVAALYLGRAFLLPIALATLMAFVLAPVVRWLARRGVPRLAATVLAMATVSLGVGGVAWVFVTQVRGLADSLPEYRANMRSKIADVRSMLGHHVEEATSTVRELTDELSHAAHMGEPGVSESSPPVIVAERVPAEGPGWSTIQGVLGSFAEWASVAGLTLLLACVMLWRWDDSCRRLVLLAGEEDRERTKRIFDEASTRVGGFLGRQLLVNAIHGTIMGLVLWWIGAPTPVVWGAFGALARFLPYLGPVASTSAPILASFASSQGWSETLLVASALLTLEFVTNNLLEPWLYCSYTGLSPLALLVSAAFWTWLWGPLGLLISTPITVCLIVAGKHVPALKFFDVLFGDEPLPTRRRRLVRRAPAADARRTSRTVP